MEYLKVKNWEQFQQYKDRDPKWIKLHRDLLYDYEFDQLSELNQLHLIKIWLLAAKLNNKIPNDTAWLRRNIGAQSNINIKQLVTAGFLDPYRNVQDCTEMYLETETEEEAEVEEEEERDKARTKKRTRLPANWKPSEKLINYLQEKRPDLDADITFENFKDYYLSHGKLMMDWNLTCMRWIRNEKFNGKTRPGTSRQTLRETAVERSERLEREALGI